MNYYDLLEISSTASIDVVKASYKVKVKQYHPDNFDDSLAKEKAGEVLRWLNCAYETLTDPVARDKYDTELGLTGQSEETRQTRTDTSTGDIYVDKVKAMILNTNGEAEYLELHKKIANLSCPDYEKVRMAEILNVLTVEKLCKDIQCANELEYLQDEVKSLNRGILFWLVVGLIATAWFPPAILIAIGFGILSYYGGKEDRQDLYIAEKAKQKVLKYRENGFDLDVDN